MLLIVSVVSCLLSLDTPEPRVASVRLIDLTGDERPERITTLDDGSFSVAVSAGARRFDPVPQALPAVDVADILATDLDGDGHTDLYVVSPADNVALLGDGTGRLRDATAELGLADDGLGRSAERVDLDGDGWADLLLHDVGGDVVFWAAPGGAFERDPATPTPRAILPTGGLDTLQLLVASAADVLALSPGHQVVFALDERGPPRVGLQALTGATTADSPTSTGASELGAGRQLGGISPVPAGPLARDAVPLFVGVSPEEKAILSHMSLVQIDDGFGTLLDTIRISDVNVQVVNGTGVTGTTNGLGNLIVGYNETGNPNGDDRTGSHNLVGGIRSSYASVGGLIAGASNTLAAEWTSVTGGFENVASAALSAVTGGEQNTASGDFASVAGGLGNEASGPHASVTGGQLNQATASLASVTGGSSNVASGDFAAVTGGSLNLASGVLGSVTGGSENEAAGPAGAVTGGRSNIAGPQEGGVARWAAVSGGLENQALGDFCSVSGGAQNEAGPVGLGAFGTGFAASVSGGQSNDAAGDYASILGGSGNRAGGNGVSFIDGPWSCVSGGQNNLASGEYSSVNGGKGNTAGWGVDGTHGFYTSVLGGVGNIASGFGGSTIAGGSGNETAAENSTICGGRDNDAFADWAAVNGGRENVASAGHATVSGGATRTASGEDDWVAGSLLEDN